MNVNQSLPFRLFKYSVYALLTLNVYFFFAEESAALVHRFGSGLAWSDIIEGYAATIDTAAWVVLLLIFELETYVLEDRHFTRRVSWTLQSVRAVCYAIIVYAFVGYLSKLLFLLAATPVADIDLCSLATQGHSIAIDLDEYVALSAANCQTLAEHGYYVLAGIDAVIGSETYPAIVRLAAVDVINSAAWLIVVAVLELEVQLQNRGRLAAPLRRGSNIVKFALYATIVAAAIYWGLAGAFVDFWDAFLWVIAFVFIELNVVAWRREDEAEAATRPA